ncbi:MAG: YmdB family metallophosphoesterase, partial [Zetaproteobacteria bacterium]
RLVDEHAIDFVVANGENLAAGFGLTARTAEEMFQAGVHVLTNGNHCWDQKEFLTLIDKDARFVRPMNFSAHAPGRGWTVQTTPSGVRIAVINLIGQVFMGPWDCPFAAADRALSEIPDDVRVVLVDFHAEATSEKMAMGWHLDGRASFVWGTHTHVPTMDARILPKGTAYQTDLGMTGNYNSIIGMKLEGALERMITKIPRRFEVIERDATLHATKVEVDVATGRAFSITPIVIPPRP